MTDDRPRTTDLAGYRVECMPAVERSLLTTLLPDPERDEADTKLTPEEELLRELVNLAVTIRDDGQVNPITVVDVSQGATHLYRIEEQ